MFYRILALFALFFFTACGGGGDDVSQNRKAANTGQWANGAGGQQAPFMPGEEPAGAAVPLKVVKIGLLVPLSGDASNVGTALMDAATLALMDKYGTMDTGTQRVKVVLVPKDTGGTPQGAEAAARDVLSKGAQMIVGPLFAQEVAAVAPIARQYGVSVLTFSNNTEVAGNGVYVFGFLVDQQVKRIVNYALDRNLGKVGLLAPSNAYGVSVQQSLAEQLSRSSMQTTVEAMYQINSNAAGEIGQIVDAYALGGSGINALMLPEGGNKLLMLSSALRDRGVGMPNVRFLGTGLWDDPQTLRSGKMNGGWYASSSPERFAAFDNRFREYFGYAPSRISALAYDAMALSASLALASSGENFSTDAITDPVGYNGPVNGIFRCQHDGICERGLAVMEVTGSGAKVIDPAPQAFDLN